MASQFILPEARTRAEMFSAHTKRRLGCVLTAAVLGCSAVSTRAATYQNDGAILAPPDIPPQIDADTFINNGSFQINFTNTVPEIDYPPVGSPLYQTQNTLNYTNAFGALLSCNSGFDFENYNSTFSMLFPAASFNNAGTINCGTADTLNYIIYAGNAWAPPFHFFFGTVAGSKCTIAATNIASGGAINMGFQSLLSVSGDSVDLTRTTMNMEGTGFATIGANNAILFVGGIFSGYWGIGDPYSELTPPFYPLGISPSSFFGNVPLETGVPFNSTPIYVATLRAGGAVATELTFPLTNPPPLTASRYLTDTFDFSGSNHYVSAVFVSNTNINLGANVYFQGTFGAATIEYTNLLGTSSNNVFVQDVFGALTNFQLVVNGQAGGRVTFIPFNYSVFQEPASLFFGPFAPTPAAPIANIPFGTFNSSATTNQYATFEPIFLPSSVVLSDVAGQDATNVPGRIEISANKFLTVPQAHIAAGNYMSLKSTNNFGSSSGAQIGAPVMDINLRSTNGSLNITNVLLPVLPRPEGFIQLFSARWTNVDVGPPTVTNHYYVLCADTHLSPVSPPRIQDLALRVTGGPTNGDSMYISDVLHVTKSLLLDANRITITTNEPGSPSVTGGIEIESSSIIWPTSTPRLQYFTNNGFYHSLNAVFFGGSRSSPYYTSNFNEPYYEFVNTGGITNFSSQIWATNFQNSGSFFASGGAIQLQLCRSALMTNGMFVAPVGQISVATRDLLVSNHVMQAGAALTLYVTNILDDGSLATESADFLLTNSVATNFTWNVNNGINLPIKPAQGSLLATTVTNTDATYANILNKWAATDMGNTPTGFTSSNSALGRLILVGQDPNSLFTFSGTGPSSNALYVDYFEMEGSLVTNRDVAGNFLGVQINPGMKIYYGQAVAGGVSVAEKLNGKNGGGFVWVSNFNTGFYSSTNVVYPDGTTNRLNTALVQSCDIDSNTNGIVNCLDPAPIFIFGPTTLSLSVAVTNTPQHKAVVSWNTVPNGTNFVYWKASMVGTNWQVLTNFVSSPVGGRVSVMDGISQGVRLYRVRVDAPK